MLYGGKGGDGSLAVCQPGASSAIAGIPTKEMLYQIWLPLLQQQPPQLDPPPPQAAPLATGPTSQSPVIAF